MQKFRVRVWKCYRAHRSSARVQKVLYPYLGYCGTGRTELTEVPGAGNKCPTELPEVPGTGMKVKQSTQKFRVLWRGRTERTTEAPGRYQNAVHVPPVFAALAYRTSRSSGYGHECPTELPEVPGTGNTQENARPRGRCSI